VGVEATQPSMADFLRFCGSCVPPSALQRVGAGVMRRLYLVNRRFNASIEKAYQRNGTETKLRMNINERYRPQAPEVARVFGYSFQWGTKRISNRYEIPASHHR
jgi:hypothetical protein